MSFIDDILGRKRDAMDVLIDVHRDRDKIERDAILAREYMMREYGGYPITSGMFEEAREMITQRAQSIVHVRINEEVFPLEQIDSIIRGIVREEIQAYISQYTSTFRPPFEDLSSFVYEDLPEVKEKNRWKALELEEKSGS